ncbi:hypothetical protein B0H19DRAFT_231058 [Mycena capillaripes]|nr:hypothetical protein B0H19DRAFT_231058 [Mycena capillaripes]
MQRDAEVGTVRVRWTMQQIGRFIYAGRARGELKTRYISEPKLWSGENSKRRNKNAGRKGSAMSLMARIRKTRYSSHKLDSRVLTCPCQVFKLQVPPQLARLCTRMFHNEATLRSRNERRTEGSNWIGIRGTSLRKSGRRGSGDHGQWAGNQSSGLLQPACPLPLLSRSFNLLQYAISARDCPQTSLPPKSVYGSRISVFLQAFVKNLSFLAVFMYCSGLIRLSGLLSSTNAFYACR